MVDAASAARVAAGLFARSGERLFLDLVEAGAAPAGGGERARARAEWDCFALFSCVRGLVAASGFAAATVAAIDALHVAVFDRWSPADHAGDTAEARRALLARRYAEYESIAQAGGASGARTVAVRLGAAAARHLAGTGEPQADVAELLGSMHETLAEAVVTLVRGEGVVPDSTATGDRDE